MVFLAALSVAALAAGRVPLLLLMIVLGVVAGGELFRLSRARGHRVVATTGLAGIVALYIVGHARGERAPVVFPAVLAAVIAVSFLAMILRHDRTGVTRGLIDTLMPVLFVGFLGAYVLALRGVAHGVRLVVGLTVMAAAADAAAAWSGRGRGPEQPGWRRPVAALGGSLAGAIVVALFMPVPFTWVRALLLAALVGPIVAAGDAIASLIEHEGARLSKRRALLYRRLDGVLLSAPVFFYAYRVLAR